MLEQLDAAVGRVLAALDRAGVADRTIVIFTSDNGGLSTAEGHPTSNSPLRGRQGLALRGGHPRAVDHRGPGRYQTRQRVRHPGRQHRLLSRPFLSSRACRSIPQQHVDGVSLVPLLSGRDARTAVPSSGTIPHYGNQGGAPAGAVRDGDWKLIEWYEDGALELYNLRDDPGEQHNVAVQQPTRAQALHSRLAAWRLSVNAVMPTAMPASAP